MGYPVIPTNGTVYLDANAIIYSVEGKQPYWGMLQPLWHAVRNNTLTVVTSELTLMETLIKPFQRNDTTIERAYRTILTSPGVWLEPISQDVLEHAARLRASTRLRTPDAIHAATARAAQCTLFITNDRDYRQCPGLPVTLLSDYSNPH